MVDSTIMIKYHSAIFEAALRSFWILLRYCKTLITFVKRSLQETSAALFADVNLIQEYCIAETGGKECNMKA